MSRSRPGGEAETDALALSTEQLQSNRFDIASRLADDLSHEIKNPLHAMVINLELAKRRVATGHGDAALERFAVIEEEIRRTHRLIDAFLRLIRPAADVEHGVELDAVLDELLPVLQAEAKVARIDFAYVRAGEGALVGVPRAALKHAVTNLFLNAVDALDGAAGRVELHCEQDAAEVRIRVSDTGPGLSVEQAERIGELGFTTRSGHAGLGLAVVRRIADDAGGGLRLDRSASATGAHFVLALPRLGER